MPNWSLTKRRKGSDDKLPTELWMLIIDMVLAKLRRPYLYCTPETFPQYQAPLQNVNNANKILTSDNWKSIRAVCRKWNAIAGAKPYYIVGETRWLGAPPDIPRGTSAVFLCGMSNGIVALECIAHLGETLTTLAFGSDYGSDDEFVNQFLENPSMFPNLRCLSLHSTHTTKSFWLTMQDDFPNLISLTVRVRAYGVAGHYRLRNLQTLAIADWLGFQLVCPSLKHLSIRFGISDTVHEFLIDHGPQLESFLADPYPPTRIAASKEFWSTMFPNLVTFGKRVAGMPRCCPPEHPVRHLVLTSDPNTVWPDSIMSEIKSFPGIQSVHIRMKDLRAGTAAQLRRSCQRRGIQIVEIVDGNSVVVQSPRPLDNLWNYILN